MKTGVYPSGYRNTYRRFFDSLEAAFNIEIHGIDSGPSSAESYAAVLLFAGNPRLELLLEKLEIPSFRLCSSSLIPLPVGTAGVIRFGSGPDIDSVLRGQALTETYSPPASGLRANPGEEVLGWCDGVPVWVSGKTGTAAHYRTSVPPAELAEDEVLWNSMRKGRFIGTLPVVHFLMHAARIDQWRPPPLRAAFIIDDPNLHRPAYGYIDFKKLINHAALHSYHVALAMVPLDIRRMSVETCELFRANTDHISLTVHGVLHTRHELARPFSREEAERHLSHGVRLMDGFERKYGIRIARVMIAPYEKISLPMVQALLTARFEGLCASGKPHPYSRVPDGTDLLAGWGMATIVAGGMPVFLRDSILYCSDAHDSCAYQDQVLKAFLGQPLLVYAHHLDFKDGFDRLEGTARYINSLGDIHWGSLDSIVRNSYLRQTRDDLLKIRMYSRHIELTVPAGIRCVEVERLVPSAANERDLIMFATGEYASLSTLSRTHTFEVIPGEPVSIMLLHPDTIDSNDFLPVKRIGFALMRRRLCELRDNARTLIRV